LPKETERASALGVMGEAGTCESVIAEYLPTVVLSIPSGTDIFTQRLRCSHTDPGPETITGKQHLSEADAAIAADDFSEKISAEPME
jgi:hypothetical protein